MKLNFDTMYVVGCSDTLNYLLVFIILKLLLHNNNYFREEFKKVFLNYELK